MPQSAFGSLTPSREPEAAADPLPAVRVLLTVQETPEDSAEPIAKVRPPPGLLVLRGGTHTAPGAALCHPPGARIAALKALDGPSCRRCLWSCVARRPGRRRRPRRRCWAA